MAISIGTQLGAHQITGLLGRGGMGEVYRGRDTKLKREVAIKTLPEEFSRDPERVARFQREAEILASLSHPNIAAIYDLEEAGGTRFLMLKTEDAANSASGIIVVQDWVNELKQLVPEKLNRHATHDPRAARLSRSPCADRQGWPRLRPAG